MNHTFHDFSVSMSINGTELILRLSQLTLFESFAQIQTPQLSNKTLARHWQDIDGMHKS